MIKKDVQTSRKHFLVHSKRLRKSLLFFALTTVSLITGVSSALAAPLEVGFEYTGGVQTWIVPETGTYQLDLWGAQGGNSSWLPKEGMKGSKSTGSIDLKKGESLEIYVGGAGKPGNYGDHSSGGWNGGGEGGLYHGGSGGGATDIRKGGSSEDDRIIVAGGGGGAGQEHDQGFSSEIGGSSSPTGEKGQFDNGGGGGGYLGGVSGNGGPDGLHTGTNDQGGSSGSSYIGVLKDGVIEYYVREGNGYAKITLLQLYEAVREGKIEDNTPPVTKVEINSITSVNDIYNSDVTISLFATDDLSGVKRTEYRIDSGEWTPYNEVVTVSKEGITNFEYRSIDNEGNTEITNTLTLKIEKLVIE